MTSGLLHWQAPQCWIKILKGRVETNRMNPAAIEKIKCLDARREDLMMIIHICKNRNKQPSPSQTKTAWSFSRVKLRLHKSVMCIPNKLKGSLGWINEAPGPRDPEEGTLRVNERKFHARGNFPATFLLPAEFGLSIWCVFLDRREHLSEYLSGML